MTLTWLGVATIVALLVLILGRITSVLVALTLVPVATGLIGGFGGRLGAFAMDGIRGVLPVASLLAFAVLFFGVMRDAGLFEPVIRRLVGRLHGDPVKIMLGTAAIATTAHLDGAGASTFMITIPAMLPLYLRARMDPLALTCTTALAAGTMNILPWSGPTTRAAAALQVGTNAIFLPVVPSLLAGMAAVFAFAYLIGMRERRRIAGLEPRAPDVRAPGGRDGAAPARGSAMLWSFNAALTIATLAVLVTDVVPPTFAFIAATGVALIVNFPDALQQRERITAHGSDAMLMVTTVFAAGVFSGILTGSGMLGAIADDLTRVLPEVVLRHLPVAMAIASMPLSLAFDPDSFYFGLLPVLAKASQGAGGSALDVARAAVLGQMTTGFPVSPLTPSTFLLIGLAGVDLADHQRRTIGYAFAVTIVMAVTALAVGAIRW